MVLGRLLNLYRAAYSLSLRDLAQEVGVNFQVLGKAELGKTVTVASMLKILDWMFNDQSQAEFADIEGVRRSIEQGGTAEARGLGAPRGTWNKYGDYLVEGETYDEMFGGSKKLKLKGQDE